jgi:hypothetical protein
MKILSLLLFLFLTISCKESENSVENVFLENLKETSDFYENISNQMIISGLVKNQERNLPNFELKQISENYEKIKNVLNNIKNKNKETQILEFERIINEVNINSKNNFQNLEKSKLENINNDISYYFIKNEFHKNLHFIILKYYKQKLSYTYCGATIYNEVEKHDLIEDLKKMKVQEFKDSICNSN